MADVAVQLTVNGQARHATVEPRTTLADFLREQCRLTGTHLGCEHGVCGACTVLVDGAAVRACLAFAVQAEGTEVTTIEGIAGPDGELSPVQSAFRDCHGLQCGFYARVRRVGDRVPARQPRPSDQDIREACRQPLSLHRVPRHRERGAAGRSAPAEGAAEAAHDRTHRTGCGGMWARVHRVEGAPAHGRRHLRRRHCATGHAAPCFVRSDFARAAIRASTRPPRSPSPASTSSSPPGPEPGREGTVARRSAPRVPRHRARRSPKAGALRR